MPNWGLHLSFSRARGTNLICLTDQSDRNWPCNTKVITRDAKKSWPPTDSDQTGPSTCGPAVHRWHPRFKGNPRKKSEPVTFGSSQRTKKPKRWLLGFLNSIWYYIRNRQVIRPWTGWICRFSVLSRSPPGEILLDLELSHLFWRARCTREGHTLSAAMRFWTRARVKQVEPVKHSPAGVSGPGTPDTDGRRLSDWFHVPDGHCWVNRALPGGPGQSRFAVLLQGITKVMTKPKEAAKYKRSD